MYKRGLVPVDGSEIADRALDEAITLTKGHPVEMKIVFIGRDDEISQQVIEVAMTKLQNLKSIPRSAHSPRCLGGIHRA